ECAVPQEICLLVYAGRLDWREEFIGGDEPAVLARPDVHGQIAGGTTQRDAFQGFHPQDTVCVRIFQPVVATPALPGTWPGSVIADALVIAVRRVKFERRAAARQARQPPLRIDLLIVTRRDLGRGAGRQLARKQVVPQVSWPDCKAAAGRHLAKL